LLAAGIAAAATVLVGTLLLEGAASTVKSASEGACAALHPDPLSAKLRALVPNFELPDLTGRKVPLRSLLGRPVLVSFFATWCPPCVAEAPTLEILAGRLGDKGTVAVVSVDEDLEALKKFYAKGSQTLVLRDKSRGVPSSFGTSQFPESFLLDGTGKVRYAFLNRRDWSVPEAVACVENLR
jgi:thiol-disulfide isomerase/thioredoxin